MSLKILFIILIAAVTPYNKSWGRVKVDNVNYFHFLKDKGKFVINLDKDVKIPPLLKIKTHIIQLSFKDAYVWPKIEKKISLRGAELDTTIMAYQYEKDIVRVRLIFDKKIEKYKDDIKVLTSKNKIEVIVPKAKNNVVSKVADKKDVLQYDEQYLKTLLTNENKTDSLEDLPKAARKEKVKEEKSSFNKYVLKFIFFMVIVLLFFYLLVMLFKKSVFNRGRIGLLNRNQLVKVLSNNYIAPKRSLLTVKVHNQIFLLSNSETGVHFLSEINDVTSLLKEGEKKLTGKNFDNSLEKVSKTDIENKVKLKEEVINSQENTNFKEKISMQIKSKIKNLKPLQ